MVAVELNQITKRFGSRVAVDDLSLQVPRGSIYGFIGPNGSGKTTTLRMIMNILLPDAGSIRLLGDARPGSCPERLGYLPEERGLYRRMKVHEALRFMAELRGRKPSTREIDAWLERLDLQDWRAHKVEALSKGMSQKVQFIAAVITRPELLIPDEPFSGLDPVNAEVIRSAVLDLRREGVTVIFSTHDMSTAETLCDAIFMIFRGRKVLDGTLTSIQDRYAADTVRVRTEGNPKVLAGLSGVEECLERGRDQELRLAPGTDPQAILRALTERTAVHLFELAKPSLHEIFVRIAGPGADETEDDAASPGVGGRGQRPPNVNP
jgi:ABC-2 type transport system ATP-binding protein